MGFMMSTPDAVLFAHCPRRQLRRIVKIADGDLPLLESRWPVDAIELVVASLAALRSVYAQTRQGLTDVDDRYQHLPILARVFACIDEDACQAAARFDANVGRHSPEHLNNIWYVGTESGLHGLLTDLAMLKLCDGVVIHYLVSPAQRRLGLNLAVCARSTRAVWSSAPWSSRRRCPESVIITG